MSLNNLEIPKMKKLIYIFLMTLISPIVCKAQLYPKNYDAIDFAFDSLYSLKYQDYMRVKDSIALAKLYRALDEKIINAAVTDELIITNSSIDSLPIGVSELSNVKKVVFINCKNLDVPKVLDQLAELPSLKSLALTNCGLYSLPDNIVKLTNLESLGLKGNKIVQLSSYITALPHLKHLDVSNNSVLNEELLFERITNMLHLTHLEANYCAIRSLPRIGVFHLSHLSLSGNLLKELNQEIKASYLDISSNPYLEVEQVIYQLSNNQNLEHLNLSNNKLTDLPSNIGDLRTLVSLNLRGNELTTLPDEIGELASLKVLKVDNPDVYLRTNQLLHLPDGLGLLTNLDSLYLSGNKLKDLPNSFAKLSSLKFLDLSWNKFENFPSEIISLSNLSYLNLAVNHIKTIPENISNLVKLNYLNCQGDFFVNYQLKIKAIPNTIGQLTQLKTLILADNVIEQIPASIGNCAQLKTLDLKDNLLNNLPESFGQLTSLKSLNLKANEFGKLPQSFSKLHALEYLNLSFNFKFESLQVSSLLINLSTLKELNLTDCYMTEEAIIELQQKLKHTEIITKIP